MDTVFQKIKTHVLLWSKIQYMTKLIDLTGLRFSRIVVLRLGERTKGGQTTWVCMCDCGVEFSAQASNIKNGKTRSCGCLRKEQLSEFNTLYKTKHKKCKTTEYRIWSGIHTRCLNKLDNGYKEYGGRGISICDRWRVFENFLLDMGERPSPNHSIDRIDVNGNYEPSNCRWATFFEQCNNKRDTVFIEYEGEKRTIAEWSKIKGLSYRIIWTRLRYGKVKGDIFRPVTPINMRTVSYDPAHKFS